MDPNRSSNRIPLLRILFFLFVLFPFLFNGLAVNAAQPEPGGVIAGTVTLPPEALEAQVNLPVNKTALSSKQDSTIEALAEAARVSTLDAVRMADDQMVRRSGERIQVQVVTTPDGLDNATEVFEDAGGQVTGVGWGDTIIQGWLSIQALESVAANPQVDYLRLPEQVSLFELEAGTYTTEGLAAMNGTAWHSAGFQGAGVKVAIIDGGFLNYPTLLGSDLPASVTVKNFVDGETDGQVNGTTVHGTACAEVVYDIAPQASMYLAKIGTNIDLQEAVTWAKSNGVDVISTSLGWYNLTPGDGTGYFANIVQDARNNGILWATAASNDREAHWGGAFNDSNADNSHEFNGTQNVDYFGPGNGDAYLINPGYAFQVFLRWDDWTAHNQDYNLYLVRWNGSAWDTVASSTDLQNGGAGQTPTEYAYYVTSGAATAYGFAVVRYSSSRNVNLEIFAPKMARLDELVHARSLGNLADSPGAVTVAALDVVSPYPQETYSSEGPTNGPGGTEGGGFIKPDISGFANVSTVSYGTVDKFNGTSAATPHVAGAAVLVQNANPAYTPDQIESFLTGRAIDMGTAGMDTVYGYGRLYLGTPNGTSFSTTFLPLVARRLPPAVPVLNSIPTPNYTGSYAVSWGAVSGASSYTLQEDTSNTFPHPTQVYNGANTSWNASGKTNGTYCYRVRSNNSAGGSAWSTSQCVVVSVQSGPTPGYWSGSGVGFYVTNDRQYVHNFAVTIYVSGCGTYKITHTVDAPITNNQFSFSGSYYASGTFTSSTSANGSGGFNNFVIYGCGTISGSFTWSATWQYSAQPAFIPQEVIRLGENQEVLQIFEPALIPNNK